MSLEPKDNSEAGSGQVASPFSTGGGGTVFELKVESSLLAVLLVGGHVPGFDRALIQELHLQSEHLGYATDDALVLAIDGNGRRRRQLWAVKHEVKFTKADDAFREVIADAWTDFSDPKRFDCDRDAIILATSPVPSTYKHLFTLLEFARAASNAEDFIAKVNRKGVVSKKSREYLRVIQELCEHTAARAVSNYELWRLIRCFHVISFDFDQTASQDEARFKTLLAIAARPNTKTGDELWNNIFEWMAERNPRAGSFTRDSLPVEWQYASSSVEWQFESGAIHRLVEHSADLQRRIKTSLGPNLHLERQDITEQLSLAFLNERFTLVTGAAGIGKSAAAFVALHKVLAGAPLFIFQAAEFARDNLDQALADLRIPEPLSRISALFALYPRKFILIESIERLLESTNREALFMLLARLAEDPTWRVVLTCRYQAAPMVKDAFLTPLGLSCFEIAVPLLADEELDQVIENVPGLRRVVSDSRTRELLRNPWFLDKACSIDWNSESATRPLDQQRLREVLWRQVVVQENVRTGGIHRQRERCFRDIALRRARSLQSFVAVEPGEEAAVQALVADELLVEEPGTHRVAPAHDVLEDWALVRWVSETFGTNREEFPQFFETLGHELPIRRSYRQWLQEALAAEAVAEIHLFVDSVLGTTNIESYWRDETLVSLLLSDEAPRFLEDHEDRLLANEKRQLQKVIHLLRVACKKPNPSFGLPEPLLGKEFGDIYLVPHGKAWGAVIRLIHRNLASFAWSDLPLILGLLEDWQTAINPQHPSPDAAREAGLIALHYWNNLENDWHMEDVLKRLASVLLGAPQAIAGEFESLLRSEYEGEPGLEGDRRHYRREILGKKILTTLEGWAACRFLPRAVADFAEKEWGIDSAVGGSSPHRRYIPGDLDAFFGLPTGLRTEYFPPSAWHGPVLPLLQGNSDVGMDLVLKLANVATERFVMIGLDRKYGQSPIQVRIDFGAGVSCTQWASPRLWMLSRQGMPGPNVLESALMALEQWLLDRAKAGQDLRDITRHLILRSNTVAITAVVASVAMAYPKSVGDTILGIISTRELFELDLRRYVQDHHSVSALFGDWTLNATKRMYNKERVDSDKLPHRSCNLEMLAQILQTGMLRDEVWKAIDYFKSQLPPARNQTERDKLWRLLLHRIDLRNFVPVERLDDGRVLLASNPPDPDVAEVVEKSAPSLKAVEEGMSLLNWRMGVFERRDIEKFDPGRWREFLNKARDAVDDPASFQDTRSAYREGGRAYIVAVCVRDHWVDLSPEERTWCREFLLLEVMTGKDNHNHTARIQRFTMEGSRAAAQVLPLLLDDADPESKTEVREGIAAAITHAVDEVRQYAAIAAGSYLWERDADLASACVAGLLDLAQLERRCYAEWRRLPLDFEQGFEGGLDDLVWQHIDVIRERIASAKPIREQAYYRFSIRDSFSVRVLPLICAIISQQRAIPLAQRLFRQIALSFVHSWRFRRGNDEQRNYEAESELRRQFGDFVAGCEGSVALRLWEPFANAIPAHADKVSEVFKEVVYAEDGSRKGEAFWAIWRESADCLLSLEDCDKRLLGEHRRLANLASGLLLDHIFWKEDARDWKPLQKHEGDLQKLFEGIGTAPSVCKSFIRLLDSVGNSLLLPEALVWLDDRLRQGNPSEMIGDRNSLFSLARILTPLVFSRTSALRRSPALRDATLRILDIMVEQGSSAAFRMRDFLVTPSAPNA
jgi:hypothetical protein